MKKTILIIVAMVCVSMTHAHELSMFDIGAINSHSSDSVTIISEDNTSYRFHDIDWHYLVINYSDGTTKIFDQSNNWIHFDTEYEMDLITDEKTDKPLKADAYWAKGAVKNIIAAEIADEYGRMSIKDGVAEYKTPYNLSLSCKYKMNEEISNHIRFTFMYYIKDGVKKGLFDLSELTGNDVMVKGSNGNVLQKVHFPSEKRMGNYYYGAPEYYDENTQKIYIDYYQWFEGKDFIIEQACSVSNGNTEVSDIYSDDVIFVRCLPSDTISRFVWTDKVCEIYYSNGDYLKYTKHDIKEYSLRGGDIFDCIIHRPDGVLTIKLEDIQQGDYRYYGTEEKLQVYQYVYTSGKYNGLISTERGTHFSYSILGVAKIIYPSTGTFIDPKTNHKLGYYKDKPDYLYDYTLKQYVTLDGKVKDFEKEAREKIEKERLSLYQKYGKQYVDALLDQGKILVGTPEGLVKYHTQSTLINETQYTRTYKIRGVLSDWAATVDVSVKTGKVTAVRNKTL